ncbi:hypothetical protein [Vulcanisaeta distributa]|uniref:hypothetical protein n=1 Tax=Vulcanisaeta distributa TaxID=164451 RepID=UPI000AC3AB74|nr:hypothetical protein [Vulcanisaeta distributa]
MDNLEQIHYQPGLIKLDTGRGYGVCLTVIIHVTDARNNIVIDILPRRRAFWRGNS